MMYLSDSRRAIPDCIMGFLKYQAEAIKSFCEWQNKSQININKICINLATCAIVLDFRVNLMNFRDSEL